MLSLLDKIHSEISQRDYTCVTVRRFPVFLMVVSLYCASPSFSVNMTCENPMYVLIIINFDTVAVDIE